MGAVGVYCGSSPGADPAFVETAVELAREIARRGLTLVYGGGRVGLMGAVADAALGAGGGVHGVITEALRDKEIAHRGLTSLEIVETMHERKLRMAEAADVFVMLPGGFGTFEEFFEVLTWTQLGVHSKACGVLNVNGFFDPLIALFDAATAQRFVRSEHRDMVIFDTRPAELLDRLDAWVPVAVDKWLDREDA